MHSANILLSPLSFEIAALHSLFVDMNRNLIRFLITAPYAAQTHLTSFKLNVIIRHYFHGEKELMFCTQRSMEYQAERVWVKKNLSFSLFTDEQITLNNKSGFNYGNDNMLFGTGFLPAAVKLT